MSCGFLIFICEFKQFLSVERLGHKNAGPLLPATYLALQTFLKIQNRNDEP